MTCARCGALYCSDHLVAKLFVDNDRVVAKGLYYCVYCAPTPNDHTVTG